MADIQYVYVGWLQDPTRMPAGVSDRLAAYGITPADYPEILKADPFANGSSAIDPARFMSLHTTFPYEPPYAGTEVVMIANGVRHRTFANARGQYRFPGTVSGPVQLQAGGVTTQLYAMGAAEEVDIDVP